MGFSEPIYISTQSVPKECKISSSNTTATCDFEGDYEVMSIQLVYISVLSVCVM